MKQKYLKINSNTIFVSNFANFEFIEKIKKRKIISNKTKIKIGYLGSSASKHTKYFSIIKPVIETILNEYGSNIQFELMGIDDDITKKYENAKYIPFVKPLKNFYQTMVNRNWDIGLAPIIDNEFERSKTDNKYREYASLGIAGIYSNLLPYKNSVIHNETGLLVNNTFEDWYCAIKRCIEENDLRKN